MKNQIKYFSLSLVLFFSFLIGANAQNNALHFDGINDYCEGLSPFLANEDFTIETWFKSENTNIGPFNRIISINGASTRLELGEDNGEIAYFVHPDVNPPPHLHSTISNTAVRDGSCHNISMVKSGQDLLIYLDGTLVLNRQMHFDNSFFSGIGTSRIGTWSAANGDFWSGEIDEIRIWGDVRTQQEIHDFMNVPLLGTEPDLISYYSFNQGIANSNNANEIELEDQSVSPNNYDVINFTLNNNSSNWIASCSNVEEYCPPIYCQNNNEESFLSYPLGPLQTSPANQSPQWYAVSGFIGIIEEGCSDNNSLSTPTATQLGPSIFAYSAGGGFAGPNLLFEQNKFYTVSLCAKVTSDNTFGFIGMKQYNSATSTYHLVSETSRIDFGDGWVDLTMKVWQADGDYEQAYFGISGGEIIPSGTTHVITNMLIDNVCISEVAAPSTCKSDFSYEIFDCGKVCFEDLSCGDINTTSLNIPGSVYDSNSGCYIFSTIGSYQVCQLITASNCADEKCVDIDIVDVSTPPLVTCNPLPPFSSSGVSCETSIFLPDPIVILSDCASSFVVTYVRSDGETINTPYQLGTTGVECIVTDDLGKSTSCFIDVVVVDDSPPSIECPSDITGSGTDVGVQVSWPDPIVSDNCGPVSIICAPNEDHLFPCGETLVWCYAEDGAGNLDSCSFIVSIECDTMPCMPVHEGDIIDFEIFDTEGIHVHDEFNCGPCGVSFFLGDPVLNNHPILAKPGPPTRAFDGATSSAPSCNVIPSVTDDMPASIINNGCAFITDDRPGFVGPNIPINIVYRDSTCSASGEILDIDPLQRWILRAYNESDVLVDSLILCNTYLCNSDCYNYDNISGTCTNVGGNGTATYWEFNTSSFFNRIEISYAGDPASSVGFALDNFIPCKRKLPVAELCGQAVLSCFSGFINGSVAGNDPVIPGHVKDDFVLGVVDVRNHDLAPPVANVEWNGANSPHPIYHHSSWTSANMGQVFGLAIDDSDNIYTTTTTVHGHMPPGSLPGAGPGTIYKIDAISHQVSVWSNLPNSLTANGNVESGLGNICYNPDNNLFYVSNFMDGKIYILDQNGSIIEAFDPPLDESAVAGQGFHDPLINSGFAPLGQRIWGIGYNQQTLYFSVWTTHQNSPSKAPNSLWSVPLSSGIFPPGTNTNGDKFSGAVKESVLPQFNNSPISDIAFSCGNEIILGSKTMHYKSSSGNGNVNHWAPGYRFAHYSRIQKFDLSNLTAPNTNYFVGNGSNNNNCSGGIDVGYGSFDPNLNTQPSVLDDLIWTTGDALIYQSNPSYRVYGLAGIDFSGNSSNTTAQTSIYIDVDNNPLTSGKTYYGDVEIFKCGSCSVDTTDCTQLGINYEDFTIEGDSCCYVASIQNDIGSEITKLCIELINAPEWIINGLQSSGNYQLVNVSNTSVCIENTNGFASGLIQDVFSFCLSEEDQAVMPADSQCLVTTFYIGEEATQCQDTTKFYCDNQGSKCLTSSVISVECDPENDYEYCLCFEVTNNSDLDALGMVLNDLTSGFDFIGGCGSTGFPYQGGWSYNLGNPILVGETDTFCVKLLSHAVILSPETIDFNITLYNLEKCCSEPAEIEVEVAPCCTPCENITSTISTESDTSCCYTLDIEYNCDYEYFSKVEINILTNGVAFGNHSNGNPAEWSMCGVSTTSICMYPFLSSHIPNGISNDLLNFCLTDVNEPSETPQLIEVKYYTDVNGEEEVACDTVHFLNCELSDNDCAFIFDEEIVCDPVNEKYTITVSVQNKSNPNFFADSLTFPPFGQVEYPYFTPKSMGLTPPLSNDGSSRTVTFCYEPPVFPDADGILPVIWWLKTANGDTCCAGHEQLIDTLILPPCSPIDSCCENPRFDFQFDEFVASLEITECKVSLDPRGLDTCGMLNVDWGDSFSDTYDTDQIICYEYDQSGNYELCLTYEVWGEVGILPCLMKEECIMIDLDCESDTSSCDLSCLLDSAKTVTLDPSPFITGAVNYNDEIIVIDNSSGVKYWDGFSLLAFGNLINPSYLCVHDGDLFAGGNFTNGTDNNVILAKYDNISMTWSTMLQVNGFGERIMSLESTSFGLVIGGALSISTSNAVGVSVQNIMLYDSGLFSSLDDNGQVGVPANVRESTLIGSKLFIYSSAPGFNLDYFDFTTSTYHSVPGSLAGPITKMIEYQGNLLTFGQHSITNTVSCNGITYDYSTTFDIATGCWSEFGGGMNNPTLGIPPYVSDAKVIGNTIIVAGRVEEAGGSTLTTSVISWNGTGWSDLGGPSILNIIPSELECLSNSLDQCELYTGGEVGFFKLECPPPCEVIDLNLSYSNSCINGDETVQLNWNNECPDFDISISLFESPNNLLVAGSQMQNISNSGLYIWAPPSNLPVGDYYIQIETIDGQTFNGPIFQIGGCACTCGQFTDPIVSQGSASTTVSCGGNILLQAPVGVLNVQGQFNCVGMCMDDGLFWQLSGPGVSQNGNLLMGNYSLNISGQSFQNPGFYTLTLSANCDNNACTNCTISFEVLPEECTCEGYEDVKLTTGGTEYVLDCSFGTSKALSVCPQLDPILSYTGKVVCSASCGFNGTLFNWSLEKDGLPYVYNGTPILQGQVSSVNPNGTYEIDLSGVPSWKPGTYSIVSNVLCGPSTKCECSAEWEVPQDCGCMCNTLKDPKPIIVEDFINPISSCNRTFHLENVGPCDEVEWRWSEFSLIGPNPVTIINDLASEQVTFNGEDGKGYILTATVQRVLWDGTLCTEYVTAKVLPVNCSPPHKFYYDGLLHTVVGDLEVEVDELADKVYISNADETGEQGIDVLLGETAGYFRMLGYSFEPNPEQDNKLITAEYYGGAKGEESRLLRTCSESYVMRGGQRYVQWSSDFEDVDQYQILIKNADGDVVTNRIIDNDSPLLFRKSDGGELYMSSLNTANQNYRSWTDQIDLILPDNVVLALEAGSSINIIVVDTTQPGFYEVRFRWAGVLSDVLYHESILMFNDLVANYALGNIIHDAWQIDPKLGFLNLPQNTNEGVRLSWPLLEELDEYGVYHENTWEYELSGSPRRPSLKFETWGQQAGGGKKSIGRVEIKSIADGEFLIYDPEELETDGISFQVYTDGVMTYESEILNNVESIETSGAGLPNMAGNRGNGVDIPFDFGLYWLNPVEFYIQDAWRPGDEIRIVSHNTGYIETDAFDIIPTDFGSFTIVEETLRGCFCSSILHGIKGDILKGFTESISGNEVCVSTEILDQYTCVIETGSVFTWNWGDGSTEVVTGSPYNACHTYADDPSNYKITFTADVYYSSWQPYLCESITVQSDGTTGVEVVDNTRGWNVYPNPSSNLLAIESIDETDKIARIQIYDIHGRKVEEWHFSSEKSESKIDLSDYQNGCYLLEVLDNRNEVLLRRKVIKI